LSLKAKLMREAHAMQMRIRNHLLAQYFPELDGYVQRSMRLVRPVLQWAAAPETIAAMDVDRFIGLVMPQAKPRERQHLVAIWRDAQQSIGCSAGPAVQHEASVLVHQLQTLREAIADTGEKIEQLCRRSPHYEHLRTIPGFGPAVSAVVIGAIGDPGRFRSAQQVLKLAGLDLSASRSGKQSEHAQPHISKCGKAQLRYALVQAALVASTFSKPTVAYYAARLEGRQREPGIKTKMRVKLAAKLLVIAWTLMKTQQPFDAARLQGCVPPVCTG
jgi:transposase